MSECDWVVRDMVPEDESCIVPWWIKSLAKGHDAREERRLAGQEAQVPHYSTLAFAEYYARVQPIVEGLLRSGARVLVACDPQRVGYEHGRLAIINAWSVIAGDVIYGVGIHAEVKKAGLTSDAARAVLGDAWTRPMRAALDIVDVHPPTLWVRDRQWSAAMRRMVDCRLQGGAANDVYASVARHISDPARVPWKPRERAA